MKANIFREKVSVGRGMYPQEYRREYDLDNCGVAAYKGSQKSIKVTSNGLVLCSDYSTIPFRKRMPVIDPYGAYTCNQTELTKDISFEWTDPTGINPPKNIKLTDYFKQKWDKEIEHTNIQCLNLGNGNKANYVPMEYCILADDRRYPTEALGKEAKRKLRELSLLAPEMRKREISNMVHQEYTTGRNGAKVIKNYDLEVGMDMTEVDGHVLAPPKLKLGGLNGNMNITTVDMQKCQELWFRYM